MFSKESEHLNLNTVFKYFSTLDFSKSFRACLKLERFAENLLAHGTRLFLCLIISLQTAEICRSPLISVKLVSVSITLKHICINPYLHNFADRKSLETIQRRFEIM